MSAKKLPWFRMYTDFLNDPKLISLAFEDQRHFIGVLALKCDGAIDDVADGDLLDRIIAQRLWIDHAVIRDVKRRLIAAGLIDARWQPLAWEKRQMRSDVDATGAERQRRYREAQKRNALRDGAVTRLEEDTDTDTDTDQKQDQELYAPKGAPATAQTPKAKARRQEPQAPAGVSPQTWADFIAVRKAKRLPMTQSALDGIEREAAKVGMTLAQAIERCAQDGWAGFKASWIERERGERIAAIAGQRHVMPEKSKRRQAIENLEAFANGTYTDPYSATLANADADPWDERSGLLVLGGNTSG